MFLFNKIKDDTGLDNIFQIDLFSFIYSAILGPAVQIAISKYCDHDGTIEALRVTAITGFCMSIIPMIVLGATMLSNLKSS